MPMGGALKQIYHDAISVGVDTESHKQSNCHYMLTYIDVVVIVGEGHVEGSANVVAIADSEHRPYIETTETHSEY